ncbi:MAG: hypothetical protein M3Z00_07240 [Actinomycetota bacterium]|nr:hypothetical protein [Actinomycetota bacterium]
MSHPVTPNPDPSPDPDDRTGSLGTPADRYNDDATPTRTFGTSDDSTYATSTTTPTPALGTPLPSTDTNSDTRADSTRSPRVVERTEYLNPAPTVDRDESPDLLTQEKAEFGGIKFGSALLGWLTTVGTIVVLAAILAAVASGMNLDSNTSSSDLTGVGLGAAIALLVVLFLGYLAGGYVAGRMARFHGVRQGIAVWLWGVVIAIALSITAAIVGSQSTILVQANLPQIPFTSSGFTWQALLALVAVLLVTLLGAILGGLMGMRFHRRIDRFAADNIPN